MESRLQYQDQNEQESAKEQKYQFISYDLRKSLVEMVFRQGLSVYRAAKVLGINQSTAKAIARKYRAKGTIFRRKCEKEDAEAHPADIPKSVNSDNNRISQTSPDNQVSRRQMNQEYQSDLPLAPIPTYYLIMPFPAGLPSWPLCMPYPFQM